MVAFTSCRGAPGATTLASVVAQVWPGEAPTWVLEADPAGGILAPRWLAHTTMSWEPGLLELASARSAIDHDLLRRCSQPLTDRVSMLPAPPTPGQVRAALLNFGAEGARQLAALEEPVMVDCGRWQPNSPSLPLFRAAEVSAVVFRPTLEESQSVVRLAAELRSDGVEPVLIAVGDGPYLPADVAAEIGGVTCLSIADDARSAQAILRRGLSSAVLRRSALGRSTRLAANGLEALVSQAQAATMTREERV